MSGILVLAICCPRARFAGRMLAIWEMAMKWIKHLLHLTEPAPHSNQLGKAPPIARKTRPPDDTRPPIDWCDIPGWDRYLAAKGGGGPLVVPTAVLHRARRPERDVHCAHLWPGHA
jgi:hypothetical protein